MGARMWSANFRRKIEPVKPENMLIVHLLLHTCYSTTALEGKVSWHWQFTSTDGKTGTMKYGDEQKQRITKFWDTSIYEGQATNSKLKLQPGQWCKASKEKALK